MQAQQLLVEVQILDEQFVSLWETFQAHRKAWKEIVGAATALAAAGLAVSGLAEPDRLKWRSTDFLFDQANGLVKRGLLRQAKEAFDAATWLASKGGQPTPGEAKALAEMEGTVQRELGRAIQLYADLEHEVRGLAPHTSCTLA